MVVFWLGVLTETVSRRFGETYSRLPLADSVDLRLRPLKLPYSKYSLGANVRSTVIKLLGWARPRSPRRRVAPTCGAARRARHGWGSSGSSSCSSHPTSSSMRILLPRRACSTTRCRRLRCPPALSRAPLSVTHFSLALRRPRTARRANWSCRCAAQGAHRGAHILCGWLPHDDLLRAAVPGACCCTTSACSAAAERQKVDQS